jgi:hypothetical protein
MRVAVVMAGLLGSYQVAIDLIMKNLILPNNADIFILTSRYNYVHASSEDDFTPYNFPASVSLVDEDCIKQCFGKHLRYFSYSEDLPGYQDELQKQKEKLKERLHSFEGEDLYFNQSSGTVYNETTYLDQYLKLKFLMPLISGYDLVMRFRIDHVLTRRLILKSVEDNTLLCGGCESYLFWGNEKTIKQICNNFLNEIGTYEPPMYLRKVSALLYGLGSDNQFYGFLKKEAINTDLSGIKVGWRLHKRDSICHIIDYGVDEAERKTSGISQKNYYSFHKSVVAYHPTFDTKQNILWSYMLY